MNRILNKFKNRYNILITISALVFLLLAFKLASLTLIRGDEFRELSTNKRLKDIPTTAPRGEIRDRYGRLLAGNKVSFTVQLIKDELNNKNLTERNDTILRLIHILKAEGITYDDDFPIVFNSFKYSDESSLSEELSPVEKVSEMIVKENLIEQLMDSTKVYSNDERVAAFVTAKKAINILENEGMDIPIEVELDGEELIYEFKKGENIEKWQKENKLSLNSDAKDSLIGIVKNRNAENIVTKLLGDPIVSEIAYEILNERGLLDGIQLEPISLKHDEEYRETKKALTSEFKTVTMDSSAIDDFINILVETNGIEELLKESFKKEDADSKKDNIVPGDIILEQLKDVGENAPIDVEVNEENSKVSYKYKSDASKVEFLKKHNLDMDTTPLDAIISVAQQEKTDEGATVIEEFIKHSDIKSYAQSILLTKYANPKISISEWEYTPIAEKNAWLNRYKLDKDASIIDNFEALKKEMKIDKSLTDYEAREILLIVDDLKKVGYRGYYPINIAYGINDKTVARLEENKLELPGVKVSVEPVRYYPFDKTASHILGYMGKIAQASEVDKYINEKGYIPGTLIGKTGVEVEFEEYLKGKDGRKIVEADAYGNIVKVVEEEPPERGDTLYLTIDAELQKIAEDSLEKALEQIRRGGSFESKWGNFAYPKGYRNAYSAAAVALDVKTGEVLALANYPGYDPNLFATGISSEDWKNLNPENNETGLPLYNTAISSPVQPGSTFKMVTGLAGLESGISPKKKIYDYGYVQVGNRKFKCLAWSNGGGSHGPTDIYRALEKSCNYYFYSVALGRIPKTGEKLGKDMDISKVLETAKKLGLDEKTGIEIPGERTIPVPDIESKTKNIKALLKRFLKTDIDKYVLEGQTLDEKAVNAAIEEIMTWVGLEDTLSKREVINRLKPLGLDGEKKLEGKREDLADIIKFTYLNSSGWGTGDSLNVSIGQGENAYTPIQMAKYISILSNGGYDHKTTVVDRIQSFDNTKKTYDKKIESKRIEMNDYKNLEEIGKGMSRVAKSEGTARRAFAGFPVDVAAKTGTAERSGISPVSKRAYDNYAWFTAYAPYEDNNPEAAEIAVSVVIFQGGSGGYAAPVAREIIAEYLGLNNEQTEIDNFNLNTKLSK